MADKYISQITPLGSSTTYLLKDKKAIENITRSGTTFTATRRDGTTFTFTQQDNNSVTGVKGNAETNYRTGNVNLTLANIIGNNTIGTVNGGTGNTSFTASRLIYSETATKLASGVNLYTDGSVLAVNSTSITTGFKFQVTGEALFTASGTDRARLRIRTVADQPNDLYLGNNNVDQWSITSRESANNYDLMIYSTGTNSLNRDVMRFNHSTGQVNIFTKGITDVLVTNSNQTESYIVHTGSKGAWKAGLYNDEYHLYSNTKSNWILALNYSNIHYRSAAFSQQVIPDANASNGLYFRDYSDKYLWYVGGYKYKTSGNMMARLITYGNDGSAADFNIIRTGEETPRNYITWSQHKVGHEILPLNNSSYNLGSNDLIWKALYSNTIIKPQDTVISSSTTIRSHYIVAPLGGSYATNISSTTGLLKIEFPVRWTSHMINFKVDIYDYSQNNLVTYHIGGYNYSGDSLWRNTSAYSVGIGNKSDLTVRFCDDGTHTCVTIGETNTAWSYVQINVRDVYIGYNSSNINNWNNAWKISFVTTQPTVSTSQEKTNINILNPVWLLTGGTATANNEDLNAAKYKTIGNYYSDGDAKSKTILHTPFGDAASTDCLSFTLKTEASLGTGTNYLRQLWRSYNSGVEAERTSANGGNSWSNWRTKLFKNSNAATALGNATTPIYATATGAVAQGYPYLRYINSTDVTTYSLEELGKTASIAYIRGTDAETTAGGNGLPTGHMVYLSAGIGHMGTPFQIGIHDSNNLYIYKRWYSSSTWSTWTKMNAGNADTATKLASTGTTGQFWRGDNTWSNTLTGTFISTASPGFQNTVSAGAWSYLRLNNGSNLWDVATKSDDNSGALQFRPNGAITNSIRFSLEGHIILHNSHQSIGQSNVGGLIVLNQDDYSYTAIGHPDHIENTEFRTKFLKQLGIKINRTDPATVIGTYLPNSKGWVLGHVYSFNDLNSTTGLPRYSTFLGTNLASKNPWIFGTNNYVEYEYQLLTTGNTVTTAQGGTGNTSFTPSRLIYSETATKLASGTIISEGDTITFNQSTDIGLIKNTYNNTVYNVIRNHNNGNISISASSVGLYLGYENTSVINFLSSKGAWNSTGLGIGTTTPSYKLHVVGNSYFNGDTIHSGTIYFGDGLSTSKPILAYSSTYPYFGIYYWNESTDVIAIDGHGKSNSKTEADLAINALGAGIISTRNRYIPHTNNTTGTVGTATKPVYVNAGAITEGTYELKATINSGAANQLAYYSAAETISGTPNITRGAYNISIVGNSSNAAQYIVSNGTNQISLHQAAGGNRGIYQNAGDVTGGWLLYWPNGSKEAHIVQSHFIIDAGNLYAGVLSSTAEHQIHARAAAGDIYMYSQGSNTGTRGIYTPTHGTGPAHYVIKIDTNNLPTYYGGQLMYRSLPNKTDHALALKDEFDNNKADIPRAQQISYYDTVSNNGSMAMGYFIAGHDTDPYGGFFVAHYKQPYYVGINGGDYAQYALVTSGAAMSISQGTANRLAYYSAAGAISSGNIVTEGNYLSNVTALSINEGHQSNYNLEVNGSTNHKGNIFIQEATAKQTAPSSDQARYIFFHDKDAYSNYHAYVGSIHTTSNEHRLYLATYSSGSSGTAGGSAQLQLVSTNAGRHYIHIGTHLRLVNNSSNDADDAVFYLENKNSNDWAQKILLDTFNYGLYIQSNGAHLLKVGTNDVLHVSDHATDISARRVDINGRLDLHRSTSIKYGYLSFYHSNYATWIEYMSGQHDGSSPQGGKPGALGNVTSWARRSLIEKASGYGWIWEYGTNTAADATTTVSTTPVMALSSNDGTLEVAGLIKSTKNSNTVTIGSQNTSYTHIYNSANIPFIFNKSVLTATGSLGNNDYPWNNIYLGNSAGTANAGIYLHGSKSNNVMIEFLVNTTDATGQGIKIGNGGVTVIGAGESARNLSVTANSETMYVLSDGAIYLEAGADTIANRIGLQINSSGNLIPVKAETINASAQNIGATNANWNAVYANNHSLYKNSGWYGDFHISVAGTANSGTNNETQGTLGEVYLRVGNNVARPAAGTGGGANNARGRVRLYGIGAYYTDILPQAPSNQSFMLPNYGGVMYAVHAGNNAAVGDASTPVYVAANGRVTPCTAYGSATNIRAKTVNINDDTSTKLYVLGATTTGYTDIYRESSVTMENNVLKGAAWNDYAEYRQAKNNSNISAGKVVYENGDDTLSISTQRLMRGCNIVSDTYGFAIGESEKAQLPIAVSGRVLAYSYESREEFKNHIGWPVCSGPNGTVSIMTEEEEMKYPSRIIGTISAVPDYEIWHGGTDIVVDGRVWIKIK